MNSGGRHSLRSAVSMQGIGLHTGEPCTMTLEPAPAQTGIVFVTPGGSIEASVDNVCGTSRCTCLRSGDAEVSTVEHVLAALFGMRVDDAFIRVDGPELPAGDGSALLFVDLIEQAGIEPRGGEPPRIEAESPGWVMDGEKCCIALPASGFRVTGLVSFDHPMIGEQAFSAWMSPEVFKREIAPARTFCMAEEVEQLRAAGLGLGGREDNVLVVHGDRYSQDLRFADEIVRHKVLDMIGDLSLIGGMPDADVMGIRSGHALHVALARRMLKEDPGRQTGPGQGG